MFSGKMLQLTFDDADCERSLKMFRVDWKSGTYYPLNECFRACCGAAGAVEQGTGTDW
jgi:hypothetical protein